MDTVSIATDHDGVEAMLGTGMLSTTLGKRPAASLTIQTAPQRIAAIDRALDEAMGKAARGTEELMAPGWEDSLRANCAVLDSASSVVVKASKASSRDGPSAVDLDVVGACGIDQLRWASPSQGFQLLRPATQEQGDGDASVAAGGSNDLVGVLACSVQGRALLEAIGVAAKELHSAEAGGGGSGPCGSFELAARGKAAQDAVELPTSDPAVSRALSEAVLLMLVTSRAAAVQQSDAASSSGHALPAVLHVTAGQGTAAGEPARDEALTAVLAAAVKAAAAALGASTEERLATAVLSPRRPRRGTAEARVQAGRAAQTQQEAPAESFLGTVRRRLAGVEVTAQELQATLGNGSMTEGQILADNILVWSGVGLIATAVGAVILVATAGWEKLDRRLVARLAAFGQDHAHRE